MTTNNLCTLEDVKSFLGITGSADDTLLEQLIERVTDSFELYCGVTKFKRDTYTEYYDGQGGKYLFLKNRPINSVTNIYQDPDWLFDVGYVSGMYKIVDGRYVVMRDDILEEGDQNIKVVYDAGFDNYPGDLVQACIEEVARKYSRRREIDVTSKSNETGGSISYLDKGLLPNTMKVLSKYRPIGAV